MAGEPLTREQMEAVIQDGRSVMHGGVIISRVEDLPSAASLAQGDPDREAAARADLQRQVADLQAQLDSMQGTQDAAAAPAEGTEPGAEQGDVSKGTRRKATPAGAAAAPAEGSADEAVPPTETPPATA